jgi:hypothetical protein
MLKKLGFYAVGACFFVAAFAIPVLFIKGAVWASEHLLARLITVGWWVLAANVLIALPLSLFKRLRGAMAVIILYSSFVYGLVAWLTGFIITYSYWGIFGVVFGLLLGGVGVVPLGLLASAFHGWDGFVPLLVLILLTFGSRVGAVMLMTSAEKHWNSSPLSTKEEANAMAAFDSLIDRPESHHEGP